MPEQLILVVEDEEAFIDALTVGLAKEGFRVAVALVRASAIRSVRRWSAIANPTTRREEMSMTVAR